jgi:hypothetical protein
VGFSVWVLMKKHKLTPTDVIAYHITRGIGDWITLQGQKIFQYQINLDREAEIAAIVREKYKEALIKVEEYRDRLFDENGQPLVNEASKAAKSIREGIPDSCCKVTSEEGLEKAE